MHQHHLLEALVDLGILDQAHEGRQAGAGGEQVEVAPRQQVVGDQGAGGLAADHDLVAHLEVLQPRGQGAVGHLDAEELQVVLVVGAGDGVGAHQRLAVHLQADHHELAVLEAQAALAGGAEAEQGVVPVMDAEHLFKRKLAHAGSSECERSPGGETYML